MAGCMKRTNGGFAESTNIMGFLLLLFCLLETSCKAVDFKPQVINLQDGQEYNGLGSSNFCYINTVVPGWKQTWTRLQVRVWSSKELEVEIAGEEEQLEELARFSFWGLIQRFISQQYNETTIGVDLFSKKMCFKIDPVDGQTPYTVKPIRKFDFYLFVVFLAGVLLFVLADSLSRSQVFYYSTGMSTGMIASLIILIFILSRFLPKKSPFYLLIFGGWSFSVYAIQLVFKNMKMILREYWHLAFGYVTVVGFISFAVCYRHGPLVEERSINILSWTLQLFGLLLIYLGIQIQQVAFAIILGAFIAKNLDYPVSLALTTWRKISLSVPWKPQPRRLLTEEEYQKQAEEETQRALEELRKYCNSPEFRPWKTVSRLQSPKRFADFVEGSPHLMQNELSVHVQEYGFGGSFFEDEFCDTDEDEEDDVRPIMQGD